VTIAGIHGRGPGLGSEFALACDLRFASPERALFGQPEVGSGGWCPATGRSRCCRRWPAARAPWRLSWRRCFDADTAAPYGWINRALPDAELSAFADRLARRIASFEQPAIVAAKTQIN
jgi:enoyl-CoA hydratase/carnithine racemase